MRPTDFSRLMRWPEITPKTNFSVVERILFIPQRTRGERFWPLFEVFLWFLCVVFLSFFNQPQKKIDLELKSDASV